MSATVEEKIECVQQFLLALRVHRIITTGGRDTAKWRTEDGKACFEFRGAFPSGCTEFRVSGDTLYLKRGSTGEVVMLERK